MWSKNKCLGCGRCAQVCPVAAITVIGNNGGKKLDLNRKACVMCGQCAATCPSGALRIIGKTLTPQQVMNEILKDEVYFHRSNGGVTFSGGEPAAQSCFVAEVLRQCRDQGIHTAMETSGSAKWSDYEKLMPYLDLLFYDLKHLDPKQHLRFTGVGNEPILDNLEKVASNFLGELVVRVPVIPGYNDSQDNAKRVGEFVAALGRVKRVDLVPYHDWGKSKYSALGRPYPLADLTRMRPLAAEPWRRILESCGLTVGIGGNESTGDDTGECL